jgi:uncharacterized membrane protein
MLHHIQLEFIKNWDLSKPLKCRKPTELNIYKWNLKYNKNTNMLPTSHFHPMIVHFPVALIIIGFLFELISAFTKKENFLSKSVLYLVILGTLGAIAGYLTGEFFTKEFTGQTGEIKEIHEFFAKSAMFTMIFLSILKIWIKLKKKEENKYKWFSLAIYFIAAVLIGITGYYGGTLVYEYMIPA